METRRKKTVTGQTPPKKKHLREHHELQILFDISSALHSSPHLKDVLHQAIMAILGTLKFRMGAIYLVKEQTEDNSLLELAAHHGFSSTLVNSIQSFVLPQKVLGALYGEKSVRWFPAGKIVFSKLRRRMGEERINEVICIALKTQKRVLGLLYVTNDGELQVRPERRGFLTTIGHQIGVAIENAQLFDSVERAKTELEISFDAIQHSIFIVDSKWRIYRVNRTSERVYGKAEDLIGRRYTEVLYERDQPLPDCPIWCCFREGHSIQREGPHPRWGGYYHYYAFPVQNATGVLERVVYYEKDVTEARKLEQRMQQSERLKALGTLAAGIAHEIRNPLATINFNTQMLQREIALSPSQEQMLDDVVREIKKIDRIVQQVLHFARPREPQFLPNQLNEIVKYCHDLAKVYLRRASVDVSLDLADDLPLLVMDFNQVSQVAMNFIINAIEAMPDGGRLHLRTCRQNDPPAVLFEIGDTGTGIMEEDKERIFDPFYTRKPDGTGLGLSISRQILERHGAYVELDTALGRGTTFRVIFPVLSSTNGVAPAAGSGGALTRE